MKINKNKGITLVALVITIIILLILAGISIQALTNQGLFAQADNANNSTKIANAKEQITIILDEWQIEKIINSTDFEDFLNKKVEENAIDRFEKTEEGKYNIYKDPYVMTADEDGNIVEDTQKSEPSINVSNIKITTDGQIEALDNSQKPGTKLQINFDASIKKGTIKSVTPAIPYTTNGTETEVTFTIIGTVDGKDYKKTVKVEFAEKYKQIEIITEDKINKVLSTKDNKTLQDEKGNIITVPAGFKIVSDDTTGNAKTVDKGIVVEDATGTDTNGSQFVWIPVGNITKLDDSTTSINLNRYTFNSDGVETKQGEKTIETYYSETASRGNTIAKSIADFKASVSANGGYYIGRYEARKNTTSGKITEVITDNVWNNITQPDAATQSRNMYDDTHPFTTDLMNSYAWDTAIVFIQNCTNIKYSRYTRVYGFFASTGTDADIKCNIYDMATNVIEWSTETSSFSNYYCVMRGGFYDSTSFYTSNRISNNTYDGINNIGFRPILYL